MVYHLPSTAQATVVPRATRNHVCWCERLLIVGNCVPATASLTVSGMGAIFLHIYYMWKAIEGYLQTSTIFECSAILLTVQYISLVSQTLSSPSRPTPFPNAVWEEGPFFTAVYSNELDAS